MNDDLELKTVRVHSDQKTLLCPFCGTEGRHYIMGAVLLPESRVPGQCPECEETFVIYVTDDMEMEKPLLIIASAIHETSKTWDYRAIDAVMQVRGQIDAIIAGVPGLGANTPQFHVYRTGNGTISFEPKNNAALRVMSLMADLIADEEDHKIIKEG